jgi:hypothetical protein
VKILLTYISGYYEKKALNDLVVLIWRLVAMMFVMGKGEGGGVKNFALKVTLSIFLRQICEFHKNIC